MGSLRSFHMVFILLSIVGADLFGGWAIREYRTGGDTAILVTGILSLAGGLGLAVYTMFLVRKMDQAHIR